MVRINIIPAELLSDQHLTAEHVEIFMCLWYANNHSPKDIPEKYTLNKGHIKFFSNKRTYLYKRLLEIRFEMIKRGMLLKKMISEYDYHLDLNENWEPTQEDFKVIYERIIERIQRKPEWYKWHGRKMPLEFWMGLYKDGIV